MSMAASSEAISSTFFVTLSPVPVFTITSCTVMSFGLDITALKSTSSFATRDTPIFFPCALSTSFASAPPTQTTSALSINFFMRGSFVSNFAPPRMNTNGRAGLKAFESSETSFSSWRPAKLRRNFGTPTMEACSR